MDRDKFRDSARDSDDASSESESGTAAAGDADRDGFDSDERPRDPSRRRILHARISEELHEALSRAANELRVPVSNLVRNALEDVFAAVDNVSVNVHDFVGRAVQEAQQVRDRIRARRAERDSADDPAAAPAAAGAGPAADPYPSVLAWQQVILHAPRSCARCSAPLSRGDRAYLGVDAPPSAEPPWLCSPCLRRVH